LRRGALFAAWLVCSAAGGYLTIVFEQAFGPSFRTLAIAVGNLPAAVLLAALVRERSWSVVLGAGWIAIALLEHAATPLLSSLLTPLAPARDTYQLTGGAPPREAYLPVWLAYYGALGLLEGIAGAALLWWHLRSRVAWVLLLAAAGLANAVDLYWLLLLPVPGVPGAGLFILGPLLDGLALGALWRFDASPPPIRLPRAAPAEAGAPS